MHILQGIQYIQDIQDIQQDGCSTERMDKKDTYHLGNGFCMHATLDCENGCVLVQVEWSPTGLNAALLNVPGSESQGVLGREIEKPTKKRKKRNKVVLFPSSSEDE